MTLFDKLTSRQKEVYDFISDKIHGRGYGPTVREIGDHFEIRSPNGVVCHLKALEKKGLISRVANRSRAIQLIADPNEQKGFPLVGRIAAGVLHEAVEQEERINFAELFDSTDPELYVLEVTGDSMIDAQIADGDFVVVHKQETAGKGQIVVAMTDEHEATLKRWFPEKNRIRLEAANSTMKPIYVKNAQVLGVVVGVVRKVG